MSTLKVTLGDWFEIRRGLSVYTRAYGESNPGDFPVYSASRTGPLTHIKHYDYSGQYLTFTTNGYGGFVEIIDGNFSINADRAILVPREDILLPDLRYLARVIEEQLRGLAIGRTGDLGKNEYTKVRPDHAKKVEFPILLDRDGNFDYQAMYDFGEKLERAAKLQRNVAARAEQIKSTNVFIDAGESTEISLGNGDLFSLSIGKRVLREELKQEGKVPVFSANAREPMGYIDQARPGMTFESPSLIWGIDGIFDWNLIPAGVPFVPTDHCGRLQIHHKDLDIEYMLYVLRATRDQYGFDRVYRANLQKIRTVSLTIPVSPAGKFDLVQQRDLAARYRRIHKISENLIQKTETLASVVVTPRI